MFNAYDIQGIEVSFTFSDLPIQLDSERLALANRNGCNILDYTSVTMRGKPFNENTLFKYHDRLFSLNKIIGVEGKWLIVDTIDERVNPAEIQFPVDETGTVFIGDFVNGEYICG